MAISRFPQLARWGAFTAVVEDGTLLRCEPFKHDPHPSPMLSSIVPILYSDQRIRKPEVRRSWLTARKTAIAACAAVTVSSKSAGIARWISLHKRIAGCGIVLAPKVFLPFLMAGPSASLVHHARSLVRRFHFAGGGAVDQAGNYSWGRPSSFYRILLAVIAR